MKQYIVLNVDQIGVKYIEQELNKYAKIGYSLKSVDNFVIYMERTISKKRGK